MTGTGYTKKGSSTIVLQIFLIFVSYGTQQPIALLKLFFERGGMFGRDKDLNWKKYKDMTFFACMGLAGGGRNEVDHRFTSMFAIFNVIFPKDETLKRIYSAILKGHLQSFPQELLGIADTLILMTLNLFKVFISFQLI